MSKSFSTKLLFFGVVIFIASFLPASQSNADIIDELKDRIQNRTSEIQKLEQEIDQYEKELVDIGEEKETLESAVQTLDVTRRKLSTDISVTENKIDTSSLTIEKLNIEIQNTEEDIINNTEAIKEILRNINTIEDTSLIELILSSDDISEFWEDIENFRKFQERIGEEVQVLIELKKILEEKREARVSEKENLVAYNQELSERKQIVDNNRYQKKVLLDETKNKESNYQELLEEKRAQKEAFEEELRRIESQLQYELDPDKIPDAGTGILLWPLAEAANESCYNSDDPVENCITQYFGNTRFAKSGAYNGETHNGMDFRASIGTPVRAALTGVVKEVNHESARWCQYGKWILIEHNNGLATLYAHLDLVRAQKGDTVVTGDTIGYSGQTGYSTGPHLHFTVYASDAVEFRNYTCKSGATVKIPVAAYSAYLNPLDYL